MCYIGPMIEPYYNIVTESEKRKQKQRARELKKTRWWQQKIVSGVCYYCEQSFAPDELTMDHKVPISRGGTSSKSNVVASCKTCNTQKKNATPVEIILS